MKKKLLQKAKNRYHNCSGKERAAKYYIDNKEVLKENANNKYRNLPEEEKVKREYGRNRYRNMKEKQTKKVLKNEIFFVQYKNE